MSSDNKTELVDSQNDLSQPLEMSYCNINQIKDKYLASKAQAVELKNKRQNAVRVLKTKVSFFCLQISQLELRVTEIDELLNSDIDEFKETLVNLKSKYTNTILSMNDDCSKLNQKLDIWQSIEIYDHNYLNDMPNEMESQQEIQLQPDVNSELDLAAELDRSLQIHMELISELDVAAEVDRSLQIQMESISELDVADELDRSQQIQQEVQVNAYETEHNYDNLECRSITKLNRDLQIRLRRKKSMNVKLQLQMLQYEEFDSEANLSIRKSTNIVKYFEWVVNNRREAFDNMLKIYNLEQLLYEEDSKYQNLYCDAISHGIDIHRKTIKLQRKYDAVENFINKFKVKNNELYERNDNQREYIFDSIYIINDFCRRIETLKKDIKQINDGEIIDKELINKIIESKFELIFDLMNFVSLKNENKNVHRIETSNNLIIEIDNVAAKNNNENDLAAQTTNSNNNNNCANSDELTDSNLTNLTIEFDVNENAATTILNETDDIYNEFVGTINKFLATLNYKKNVNECANDVVTSVEDAADTTTDIIEKKEVDKIITEYNEDATTTNTTFMLNEQKEFASDPTTDVDLNGDFEAADIHFD